MIVPNVVKLFLWKPCKNGLSTLYNLKHRKVLSEDMCDLCKHMPEIGHALWMCPTTKNVWSNSSLMLQKITYQSEFFMEVWAAWVKILAKEELMITTITIQLI